MRQGSIACALMGLGLAASSCHQPDPARLAAAQGLVRTCDSLAADVNAMDMAGYQRMDSTFSMQRVWFERRFRDTLDTATATILGNYHRAMTGPLQQLLHERPVLLKELELAKHQVEALGKDAGNDVMDDTQLDAAFAQETRSIRQLSVNVGVLQRSAQAADRGWELYHAKVDSLVAATDTAASVSTLMIH